MNTKLKRESVSKLKLKSLEKKGKINDPVYRVLKGDDQEGTLIPNYFSRILLKSASTSVDTYVILLPALVEAYDNIQL